MPQTDKTSNIPITSRSGTYLPFFPCLYEHCNTVGLVLELLTCWLISCYDEVWIWPGTGLCPSGTRTAALLLPPSSLDIELMPYKNRLSSLHAVDLSWNFKLVSNKMKLNIHCCVPNRKYEVALCGAEGWERSWEVLQQRWCQSQRHCYKKKRCISCKALTRSKENRKCLISTHPPPCDEKKCMTTQKMCSLDILGKKSEQ